MEERNKGILLSYQTFRAVLIIMQFNDLNELNNNQLVYAYNVNVGA